MLTIAWDVDDVLNNLMAEWLRDKWLPEHPGCGVTFEQIIENPPERILKSTREEYLESLDAYRLSGKYMLMPPNSETLNWFQASGDKARHIALTAVPLKAAHVSAHWVMKNFGKWIRGFHFVPSFRTGKVPSYDENKASYLKWLDKVDVLVDDNPENIQQAQNMGIRGILISRPWNKSSLTLKEALKELDALILSKENHD
jgi:5'(3')-deoxyribonucleotidase